MPLIFGGGMLFAIVIVFSVGLSSRTADSKAPVLGAHLHSLLAFGSNRRFSSARTGRARSAWMVVAP